MSDKRITTLDIKARKQHMHQATGNQAPKLVMVTAYDATFAHLLDAAGVDILLVGDSLGMVIQGHNTTLPVTLEHMIYHTAAVRRGSHRAHIVADMPFMTYQASTEQALMSAGRLMQEGQAHAVKIEGGSSMCSTVEKLTTAGIPVMGHIGLTPQSVHQLGGFRVQGRDALSARKLLADAKALEDSGCYSLVLEGIPLHLAESITRHIHIPTIGIGAGPSCDGQVLVSYDLLGMNPHFKPKFVKTYASLHATITESIRDFITDVQNGTFPSKEFCYDIPTSLRLVDDNDTLLNPDDRDTLDNVYGVPV